MKKKLKSTEQEIVIKNTGQHYQKGETWERKLMCFLYQLRNPVSQTQLLVIWDGGGGEAACSAKSAHSPIQITAREVTINTKTIA